VIQDKLIICVASSWDLDPTSKHHLMRILSRRNDVVWVNYHGSRTPRFNRGDVGSMASALRRVTRGLRPIHSRMAQITPLVWPGPPSRLRGWLNRALLVRQIRRAVVARRRDPDQAVQLWTFAPDVDYLAGAFGEECLVYYCVDEFSEFAGFDRSAIAAAERRTMAAADVVVTTSAKLHGARVGLRDRVHLVRHGVDHAHFARALYDAVGIPKPIRHVKGPIAGFIGLVQHWFDVDLMGRVAGANADVSFVIVGECQIDVTSLEKLPNVYFVGRQAYETLPAYCAAFDVGLIPFVRSSMTENVNPIKLREYLAAGLPVVSTNLPEARAFAPDVILADDAEGFSAGLRQAIESATAVARAARSASVAGQSWEGVTARVSRLVMEAVDAPRQAPAVPMTSPIAVASAV
jgi:glycosyltransferase involved in cell wall biosynthesis